MEERWFVGYGSLIFEPDYKGHRLDDWCEAPDHGCMCEGVDFLYPSSRRSGAPTLTFDGSRRGVRVKCWRAVGPQNIQQAEKYMKDREGCLREIDVMLDTGISITGLCANLPAKLKGESPRKIAERPVKSEIEERKKGTERGGITYIKKCKEIGLKTPLMNPILQEIENICKEHRLGL